MSVEFQSLVRILRDGLNTNSYKFALARSLVRWVQTSGNPSPDVSRLWLAKQFVDLYWPLTIRFRLRQATDPSRDPVVMRMIRDVVGKLGLGPETKRATLTERFPQEHAGLVARVERQAFRDVVPRFHTVRRVAASPPLYEPTSSGLRFTAAGLDAFQIFDNAIDFMALGAWVRFTEQYSSAPHLFEKLEGDLRRGDLSRYRSFLLQHQEGRCFYCQGPADVNGAVDHVIPWSFVAEDRIWNLVVSCAACNSEKSDRLPGEDFIKKIVERNGVFVPGGGLIHPFQKDIREWLDVAALAKHIESLAMRCREDGFGEWSPQ